ncbi:diaminopimelate decarboxylase [Magnetococcus marinus MC-1]|uniref:Diaminopimelate decarboxylase n=1 Tax=Magnetococcus marinus (strain ATCC BAA-1437 / JCM 17883 / MC-1) TaxID=156889 RepID=A0LE32_MAGMM|nr:diaminopimelate decarboxylase [Magnetococcus marinus MC-1]
MDYFHYQDDQLFCEEVALEQIAQAVGTPFYCYSERTLLHHLQVFQQAFASQDSLICYSVKANSNLAVLDALAKQGAGFDIVSGGELERVRRVGCPGERVVFSGVGKSRAEIQAALAYGVRMFNVESIPELQRIQEVALAMDVAAPVTLRINPDVDPKTHPYISTGLKRNKFGIPFGEAVAVYQQAAQMSHVQVVGLDCHIGSQLTQLSPFVDALKRVMVLIQALKGHGIEIKNLDLGGGLGIPYEDGDTPPSPAELAAALLEQLDGMPVTVILEPGRAIVGNAGVLVTRVEYVKKGEQRHFVITDAGMNDLLRPAIYNAYHGVIPLQRKFDREEQVVDVVGPICETGDFFARDRYLSEVYQGELLAVRSAGAYGFVMSSNYNTRPRVAEVLVRGDRYAVVRKRESVAQLLENESLFEDA